jgi:hypothetical protein
MRKYFVILILSLGFMSIGSISCWAGSDWTGNINLLYGMRTLTGDNWPVDTSDKDLSKQNLVGFNADFGKKSWPINIAFGIIQSSKNANRYEVSTSELKLGVKKIWMTSTNIHTYLGVEGAFINAEEKNSSRMSEYYGTFSGNGHGIGLNGGLYWTLANHFNLGAELGFLLGKANLDPNESMDLTGTQMALFLGYHW